MMSLAAAAKVKAPPGAQAADPSYWPNLARYHDENERILRLGRKTDVVFIGDSITEMWVWESRPFWRPGFVGRGISGQKTGQMLQRFRQDVLQLRPGAVHILAGINDLRARNDPLVLELAQNNVASMADLALAHGIVPILATILPYRDITNWKAELTRPFNVWVRGFAAEKKIPFADYVAAVADTSGRLRADLSIDGLLHLNSAGYAAIEPITRRAVELAIAR